VDATAVEELGSREGSSCPITCRSFNPRDSYGFIIESTWEDANSTNLTYRPVSFTRNHAVYSDKHIIGEEGLQRVPLSQSMDAPKGDRKGHLEHSDQKGRLNLQAWANRYLLLAWVGKDTQGPAISFRTDLLLLTALSRSNRIILDI
jgi:hypothetical protein